MSTREFRDDDAGYLDWLDIHPDGYVINIARSHNPTGARLHHAGCHWIRGQNRHGGKLTGPYVKWRRLRTSELSAPLGLLLACMSNGIGMDPPDCKSSPSYSVERVPGRR